MPPKVLHLVISLAHGGLERLVVDWTNERNKRNPGSTLIGCLDEIGDLAAQVEGNAVLSVQAARSRWPFDVGAVRRLRKLLTSSSITVLHSHNVAAWQYGVLACLGTGVKHIHTEHGTNPHYKGAINRLRNAWLWRLTDVVVVVADRVAEQIESRQGIPKARLCVIPNGVMMTTEAASPASGLKEEIKNINMDAQDMQDREAGSSSESSCPSCVSMLRTDSSGAVREALGIPPHAVVIGSVGRLAQVKGYDRLLGVFKKIIGYQLSVIGDKWGTLCTTHNHEPITHNPLCLLLVGDGPERTALEKLARDLGIADKVVFAGYQANPAPYLRAMDLFVLTSRSEGLSISLLEAMAAGIPVAVTDVGECRRVVDEGRAGVVLPDSESEWPEVFLSILQDPAAAQARVEAARTRVRESYSMKTTIDSYESLYCVGRVSPPALSGRGG